MKSISLANGQKTWVDDEDYRWLSKMKWHLSNEGYVIRSIYLGILNGKELTEHVVMHRLIMNTPKGMTTDHINHDKLDNRRCNLRICTAEDNNKNKKLYKNNTSGYIGVYKHGDKWRAQITPNKRRIHLGLFPTAEEAAKVRDEHLKVHYGEFACLNF